MGPSHPEAGIYQGLEDGATDTVRVGVGVCKDVLHLTWLGTGGEIAVMGWAWPSSGHLGGPV